MARVEDQASLAAAEADLTHAAARRLDVVFRSGAGIFSVLLLLIAWELFARSGRVTMFMLPPFTVVAKYIATDAVSGDLWINLGTDALSGDGRILHRGFGRDHAGDADVARARWYAGSSIRSSRSAFRCRKSPSCRSSSLWLGLYDFSKISIVVFDAIFPVVTATLAGIAAVEKELLWSARNMGANERQLMWQIVLPAASPQIMTGLQVALPIALIVEIIAEMVMGGYGLGGAMMSASRFANSAGVFAGIVEIAIVGFVLIKAMAVLRRRLLVWHQETAEPTTT